jgi:hypothetical protein
VLVNLENTGSKAKQIFRLATHDKTDLKGDVTEQCSFSNGRYSHWYHKLAHGAIDATVRFLMVHTTTFMKQFVLQP